MEDVSGAKILDGRAVADKIQSEIADRCQVYTKHSGIVPTLAAVLVGEDPASKVYVRNKQRACKRAGLDSQLHRLSADASTDEVLSLISTLNEDSAVHGILVQLPLPKQVDSQVVLDAIDPAKDVDAFHPTNVGLISQGRPRFLPCTPHGILQLLARSGVDIQGRRAVVIGRSEIVGKPMAMLLAQPHSPLGPGVTNATVTLCHSRTKNLADYTRDADLLVVAIGRPNFVTGDMVKPGAVVIDVGINRGDDGLVGDVDFASCARVASMITPVPGGIGPLTVTMLLENTLTAAEQQSIAAG